MLASHHRNARIGPHPEEARAIRPAAHSVVSSAKGPANDDGELGDRRVGDGVDHLRPVLGDSSSLVLFSNHEASDVLKKDQRQPARLAKFDEVSALERALGEQDAVGCEDSYRESPNPCEGRHQGSPIKGLEFSKLARVNNALEQRTDVIALADVPREDPVNLIGGPERELRLEKGRLQPAGRGSAGEGAQELERDLAGLVEGIFFGKGVVIGNSRDPAMDVGATELFRRDLFSGSGLHQGWAPEEDRAGALDHYRLVAHGGDISAASRGGAKHDRNLRYAGRRHASLVVKNPPKVLAVGENLVLKWKEGAPGVHQVEAGEAVFPGDLLCSQVLFYRDWKVSAALDRSIVCQDHDGDAMHSSNSGNDARRGSGSVVEPPSCKRAGLEERASRIEEPFDSLPCQQLPCLAVLPSALLRAPLLHFRQAPSELFDKPQVISSLWVQLIDDERRILHGGKCPWVDIAVFGLRGQV